MRIRRPLLRYPTPANASSTAISGDSTDDTIAISRSGAECADHNFRAGAVFYRCAVKSHPSEPERLDGFSDPARKLSCRSVRAVARPVAAGIPRVLPVGETSRIGGLSTAAHAILSRAATCYTVSGWLANASANTSSQILTGGNKSRAPYAFRRNPSCPSWRRAATLTAGSRSEPGTAK